MDPQQDLRAEFEPRKRSFITELLVPEWRPSREQVLWAIRIVLWVVVLLGSLTLLGLPFDITLWNWLDLLIIPVVLAIGGYMFTLSENRATRAVAQRRAEEEALQAYLDQMGQLLLDKDQPLRQSEKDSEARTLARARTLTVLTRLDGESKVSVVQFLYEAGLIVADRQVLDLSLADLRRVDLSGADLSFANLTDANVYQGQLDQAQSLEGATMPNGQNYKDWLKSRQEAEEDD